MEDPNSEATQKWVKAQNDITNNYFETLPLRNKVKQKLTEYLDYPTISVPAKHGSYYYFTYNTGLQNQNVIYRMKKPNYYKVQNVNLTEDAEVFMDPNTLSTDGTASLYSTAFSEDGNYWAY